MLTLDVTTLSVPDVAGWMERIRLDVVAALPALGEALVEHCDRCFETSTDPWGNPWPPFSPNTRRGRDPTAKLLVDRGYLRRSLHYYLDVDSNGDAVVRVAVGGPAAEYAPVHQWGGEHTPARAYLPLVGDPGSPTVQLPPELEEELHSLLQAAVDRSVERLNAQRASAPATGTGG